MSAQIIFMTTKIVAERARAGAMPGWEVELDAELLSGARAMTAGRAEALAGRLARIPGVEVAAVRPHCGDRFVLVSLAVQARTASDAVDRAVAVLRSCAAAAGVGPLVLVAARVPGF